MERSSTLAAELTLVVLGDRRVGKSCLTNTLCHGVFREAYSGTVGVDYDSRILEVDGKLVKLNLWDTSGEELFLWAARKHLGVADGLVFVYDVTDSASFESIPRWLSQAGRVTSHRLPKLLVGNKLDLRHKQVVSCHKAKEFAIPEGMSHIETSSDTGKNVNAAFYILARDILRYRKLGTGQRLATQDTFPVVRYPDIHIHEDVPSANNLADGAEYTHLFKILLLGDVRTGKTALRYRFCRDYFPTDYVATAAFDYSSRTALLDGAKIKLQIWDVSGDDIYEQTRKGYYRGANAFVVLYDVTDRTSFARAETLLQDIQNAGRGDAPKVIVANKCDLVHKRQVHHSDAAEWADGWKLPLLETSAYTGANVDAVFFRIVEALQRQLAPWRRLYSAPTHLEQ